jgi:hypothetical protein
MPAEVTGRWLAGAGGGWSLSGVGKPEWSRAGGGVLAVRVVGFEPTRASRPRGV